MSGRRGQGRDTGRPIERRRRPIGHRGGRTGGNGNHGAEPEQRQAWREATGALARVQARQQRQLDRDPSPGSVRSIADHPGGESTRRHGLTREPDPVQGAERAAG